MERHYGKVTWLVLALCAGGLVYHALQYPFISDDGYISFRYAYNLAHGHGLTFNPGERVEGYTNFLWTVMLAGFLKLGVRPDAASRIMGVLFALGTLVLVHLLTRLYRGGRPTGWAYLAPALLAASGTYAVWCSGGLETQMFAFWTVLGAYLYMAEHQGRVSLRLSGLVFALAAMTRPEGLLLMGLTGLHRLSASLLGERRLMPRLAEVGWVAGFLIPFGIYFAWRYSYFGYPFPNTYYIKAGEGASASLTRWGLPYLWDFIKDNRLYVLPALIPLFWPRTCVDPCPTGKPGMRPWSFWSYLGLITLPYCAYVTSVGGDFMTLGRFFLPMLPFLAIFAQEGLREAVERPRAGRLPDAWRPIPMLVIGVLLVGLTAYNAKQLHTDAKKLGYYRWGLDTVAYLRKFADDRILIGTWMRHNLPRDTYLAVGGAGAIVYASRLRSLDTFGLNDAWIAHNTPKVGDRPGHGKTAPDHYLLEQKPDLMCHQAKQQDWPHKPADGDPFWRDRGYHWVCITPNRLDPDLFPPELERGYTMRPSHYCCLKRMDRALGPFPAVTP